MSTTTNRRGERRNVCSAFESKNEEVQMWVLLVIYIQVLGVCVHWMLVIICCHITTHTEPEHWSPGVRNRNRWRSGGPGQTCSMGTFSSIRAALLSDNQRNTHMVTIIVASWHVHNDVTNIFEWWCEGWRRKRKTNINDIFLHFQKEDFPGFSLYFIWYSFRSDHFSHVWKIINLNFPNSWQNWICFEVPTIIPSVLGPSTFRARVCPGLRSWWWWPLGTCHSLLMTILPRAPALPRWSLRAPLFLFSTNLSSLQWSLQRCT